MKTNAPKKITWWIGCILLILGVVAMFVPALNVSIPVFANLKTVFLFVSALLYALATALKGL